MRLIRTTGRSAREAAETLAKIENRGSVALHAVLPQVRRIVTDVRRHGDRALLRCAKKFDGLPRPEAIRVTPEEMASAWDSLGRSRLRTALITAAAQIRIFAHWQRPVSWNKCATGGATTGQLVRPLSAVGCYVPSGRHPLPSTLLMTVIPALVAGVRRIVVVSPKPARETLAAAHLLSMPEQYRAPGTANWIDPIERPWTPEFYRIGGAHAIAALAYGTESIPRVDKIAGPGSLYVTAAKRVVAFDCSIDMLAGPTEIVVVSDLGDSAFIASDLVAQAEHDPQALAIVITTREPLAKAVIAETKSRCKGNAVAREALANNGFAILAASADEAHEIANRIAPEHLTVDAPSDLEWVQNAGSVFVGPWSAQPLGDYISGPNHTLPTGGMARVRGGLSANDFVKLITVQEYCPQALRVFGPQATLLAEAEGLDAHAESIRVRLQARRSRG